MKQKKEAFALMREALRWIDKRCPPYVLLHEANMIHCHMAYDAGLCARTALAAANKAEQESAQRAADLGQEIDADRWQPIKTAPLDTWVLVHFAESKIGEVRKARKNKLGIWSYRRGAYIFWPPSHWMPLPAPPKEQA